MQFAVDVNGTPVSLKVVSGPFDGFGSWNLSTGYNDPALTGVALDLVTFGLNAAGKIRATRTETVTFQ